MRIDVSNTISQITESKSFWEKIAPNLSPQENIQDSGVNAEDISRYFEEVLALLNVLNEAEVIDIIGWQVNKSTINSSVNSILQLLQNYWNNPSQISGNITNICSWLWTIRNCINQLLPIQQEVENFSSDFKKSLSGKIFTVENWISQAELHKKVIFDIKESITGLLEEIKSQQNNAKEAQEAANTSVSAIQLLEREISTAKTNAEAAAASATSEYNTVKELVILLHGSVAQKDELFKEFESRRDEITSLLENANKVGLARAFQLRRKALVRTWIIWAILFTIGIISLICIGFKELLPLLSVPNMASDEIAIKVAVRLLLVGPIVWFTWFSARQYSHALRMGEDYAFKEAAAMAFAGYRNEVLGDAEMLKLLQESAIRSFSANPAKILLKNADHTSPLSEAIDKALEKIKPKDLISAINDFIKKQE
jgi:hypothetical protein